MSRKSCCGLDKITWKKYRNSLDENLLSLVDKLRKKTYKTNRFFKREIIDFSGRKLVLFIPTVEDRIVQRGLKNILEPILDVKCFKKFVHGFRKGTNRTTALRNCHDFLSQGKVYVVDIDIEKVSLNIQTEEIIRVLNSYISDGSLLIFIRNILDSFPYPLFNGSGLSPLLINMMLSEADKHFTNENIVRFADNYLIFCRSYNEASAKFALTKGILESNGFIVATNKSRILIQPNLEDLILI